MPRNNRRRPSPPVTIQEDYESANQKSKQPTNEGVVPDESFWSRLLEDIGLNKKVQADESKLTPPSPINKIFGMLNATTTSITSTTTLPTTTTTTMTSKLTAPTTTTFTTTTTTSTTSQATDAPNIHTNNLFANAGADMHIYYPSRMCILNGIQTRFVPKSASEKIERWLWIKLDSSPAFGVK